MELKILQLLRNNEFVSGEKLAESLNVSRVAVWKQIKYLQKLGYKIESVKNKGYKLTFRPDALLSEEIKAELNTQIIGKEIHYFKSISSTNLYAKNLAEENAVDGAVVVADVQTTGRGRKNRSWFSPYGGLWFSVILRPGLSPERGMLLTMASSTSVAQGIKKVTGLDVVIKWPNDLLLDGKKVCGILTEFDAELDKINYAVVGIGLNVNNEIGTEIKETATSLSKSIGSNISRLKLLRAILKCFDENYLELYSGNYEYIRSSWSSLANIIGKKIKVEDDGDVISGVVFDVDDSGCLILETQAGKTRIVSGDVTYL